MNMVRLFKSLQIRTWIGIGISFLGAVLLVFSGFLLLFIQHVDEQENNEWVIHTYQVINKLEKLEALLVDVETGSRGYVATGPVFYGPMM
jgi:CHASE3 domain sensor protein